MQSLPSLAPTPQEAMHRPAPEGRTCVNHGWQRRQDRRLQAQHRHASLRDALTEAGAVRFDGKHDLLGGVLAEN